MGSPLLKEYGPKCTSEYRDGCISARAGCNEEGLLLALPALVRTVIQNRMRLIDAATLRARSRRVLLRTRTLCKCARGGFTWIYLTAARGVLKYKGRYYDVTSRPSSVLCHGQAGRGIVFATCRELRLDLSLRKSSSRWQPWAVGDRRSISHASPSRPCTNFTRYWTTVTSLLCEPGLLQLYELSRCLR